MELDELLEELLKLEPDAVAEAMKKKAKKIYQVVFNAGHAVATATLEPKLETAEAAKKTAEEAKKVAETALAAERRDKPDVEKLHTDYGRQVVDLTSKIDELETARKQDKIDFTKNTASSKLMALLAAKIDKDYAEVQTQKSSIVKRIEIHEDGTFRVLQDGQSIPFAGDSDAQLNALAEEIISKTPDALVLANVPRGTGRENAGGGSTPTKGKALYDSIREKAKNAGKTPGADSIADRQAELDKRMGIVRA